MTPQEIILKKIPSLSSEEVEDIIHDYNHNNTDTVCSVCKCEVNESDLEISRFTGDGYNDPHESVMKCPVCHVEEPGLDPISLEDFVIKNHI